ncbi:MAG: epoxide hydrolase [bacterium]|nr:epoxide hydrolase [bacterium]
MVRTSWLVCLLLPVGLLAQSSAIREFRIQVDDRVLTDLNDRLDRTRFPDQIPGSGWDYGSDTAYLRELVDYWRNEYDWRKHEAMLNELPHFKTEIDGLDLHFVHIRSTEPDAFPLVMTHGWPGSFYEFLEVIGPLRDPAAHGGDRADAFHLVLPSMPGYGFSGKPKKRGFDVPRIAETITELMARLDYPRYGAQGGDWGSGVSQWLAILDAEHVAGIHLNLVGGGPPAGMESPREGIPEWELKRWRERQQWWAGENAYGNIQGTKPLTLAYGLNDSPAGLAGWVVEKFRTWSDSKGDIESRFSKDQLLTNIMIYWVTETMPSAVRLYYESRRTRRKAPKVETPTAIAVFPVEIFYSPRKWVETRYNVQQWTEMPRGGHFAAMEEPELLIEDIRKFFRGLR